MALVGIAAKVAQWGARALTSRFAASAGTVAKKGIEKGAKTAWKNKKATALVGAEIASDGLISDIAMDLVSMGKATYDFLSELPTAQTLAIAAAVATATYAAYSYLTGDNKNNMQAQPAHAKAHL